MRGKKKTIQTFSRGGGQRLNKLISLGWPKRLKGKSCYNSVWDSYRITILNGVVFNIRAAMETIVRISEPFFAIETENV